MASIDKLPSGRFRVRWRTPDMAQQSKSFGTKADADAYRRQIERELDEGVALSSADRRLTVGEYVTRPDGWLESRAWRDSSREKFDGIWRTHLEPRWGGVRLNAVTRTAVQGWVNELEQAGYAPGTVRNIHTRLLSILRAAYDDGVSTRRAVSGIVLPERAAVGQKKQVPTLKQVEEMADAVADRYDALVWTCAVLGLRPAEAVGLTVDRVDFLRRVATIDRQLTTPTKGEPRFAPLKTRRMPSREVPVPTEIVERLAAHLEQFPAIELDGERLIFSNADGLPIRRAGLGHVWRTAAKQVDLPGEFRGWHSLRDFAITRLIVAGVNPDYVRQFAGHTTLTETLNTYAGWWPSDADNARDALSAALAGLGEGSPALGSV